MKSTLFFMCSFLVVLSCRAQGFGIYAISDSVYQSMWGKSYKEDCTVPRSSLRYLTVLHYDADGKVVQGELVCHKDIAADLIEIFRQLYKARYPIERMRLIDCYGADDERSMENNNTSCFNFRAVAGSNKLSKHSQGKAIDINPLYNPCVKRRKDGKLMVNPQKGRKFADRSKSFKQKIDKEDICYKLFIAHGFEWGGNWRSLKDYQHFEKK